MKVFKRIKWSYVVLSAMFLLLGIYLVVNPETSLIMICRIPGAALAVFGVMKIVLYFIHEVEGVAIRFNPFGGKQGLTIIMGVSLIVDGVQNLGTVVYAAVFVKDVKAAVHDFVADATAVETTGEVIGEDDAGARPDEGPKAP